MRDDCAVFGRTKDGGVEERTEGLGVAGNELVRDGVRSLIRNPLSITLRLDAWQPAPSKTRRAGKQGKVEGEGGKKRKGG